MSSYSELIKNYEKIRAYMREFYVYGFKSRDEYDKKSSRSYDDERRRIESWLGNYMRFVRTPDGKNVFLSIDSRAEKHNPLYKSWKAKSFTDGDITLHFILFDILHTPGIKKTAGELMTEIDNNYLSAFEKPMMFDESTLRKKLKEYCNEGIIISEKQGKNVYYSRAESTDLSSAVDALDYFSEAAPCGVIGSFLLDKVENHDSPFSFKHHYITGTMDSDVLAMLFCAIHSKRKIFAVNIGKHNRAPQNIEVVPLKIYISVQNGRQNLIAFSLKSKHIYSYRLDYLSDIVIGEVYDKYDDLQKTFAQLEKHMWGVNCNFNTRKLEHVEFTVFVRDDEQYIVERLEREKRCGTVEKTDETHYRFYADVFDTSEVIPWIRTFICRITKLNFSDRLIEEQFKNDIRDMYALYGLDGGDEK